MIQTNSNWNNKTQVKKRNIGERIIKELLEKEGYIVYETTTEGAHGFDKFAMKNKETIIYVECKSKARRNKYPDTGIDIKHYNDYKRISEKYNMDIYIFFIDEMLGEIYGNWLRELEKPTKIIHKSVTINYPLKSKGIIYFPLINMNRNIRKLNKHEIQLLRQYSTRNYDYVIHSK